jgi:hypothetical protein
MTDILRIVLAIFTLLTVLAMLGFAVFALTIPHFGLFAVTLILALGIGYFFSYRDYLRFFGKKTTDEPKQE